MTEVLVLVLVLIEGWRACAGSGGAGSGGGVGRSRVQRGGGRELRVGGGCRRRGGLSEDAPDTGLDCHGYLRCWVVVRIFFGFFFFCFVFSNGGNGLEIGSVAGMIVFLFTCSAGTMVERVRCF